MCLINPLFTKQPCFDMRFFFQPHLLYIEWLNHIYKDTVALMDIVEGLSKPKEKPQEVRQEYSVTKKNGNLVIVNKDGYIVYQPPHFLKRYIKNGAGLKKLAQTFTERNTTDIEAIMEFESSLK